MTLTCRKCHPRQCTSKCAASWRSLARRPYCRPCATTPPCARPPSRSLPKVSFLCAGSVDPHTNSQAQTQATYKHSHAHIQSHFFRLSGLSICFVGVTLAPKIRKEVYTQLDWGAWNPAELMCRYRAFGDTVGVFTHLWDRRTRVKIEAMSLAHDMLAEEHAALALLPAGQITFSRHARNRLLVSCRGGAVSVQRLKVEGKASVDANSFANGYLKPKEGVFQFQFVSLL